LPPAVLFAALNLLKIPAEAANLSGGIIVGIMFMKAGGLTSLK